ncbi:specific histone demethylase [Seminavis robusta]|uniref:Specific histone demethylase n=1 Tax=Seminavis robusta TaxID=568900 RepID=A0A9N8DX00_9STRA|nr:specific histone demethylase [Seminavis robusta]|eukprot:Sro427_g140750.1 specific histone demethylase (406) ;mRNA; r:65284-66501
MFLLDLLLLLASCCSPVQSETTTKTYHTTIVGAGAAGLAASYTLLNDGGVPFQDIIILEASERLGGRVWKDTTFTNSELALELGGSFVQYPSAIARIMRESDPSRNLRRPADTGLPTFSNNYTYWDFLNDHIAPKRQDAMIQYHCRVNRVDYQNDSVISTCEDGRSFRSDHAIVTVPLPILQDGDINFQPPLPDSMTINHPGSMWQGIKVFLEFNNDFFNGFCLEELGVCLNMKGENLFWDFTSVNAGFLTSGNTMMAGFILGDQSEPYIGLEDEQILQKVLAMLDNEFNARASMHYVRGFVWNWSADQNFRGTLSSCGYDCSGDNPSGAQNIKDKVWIAGEAFPIDGENGWVDAGAFSGDDAAKEILLLSKGVAVPSGLFWDRVQSDVTASPTAAPTNGTVLWP